DARHRRRGDPMALLSGQNDAARSAAGQGGDRDMAAHRRCRRIEILGLIQRADLVLVGEQDIDLARHQLAEGGAVAVDAERIGQAQRDLPPGPMGNRRRGAERRLRAPPEPPSEAIPAIVLPAEPPELSIAGPIRRYSDSARSASTSVIAPLAKP